MNRYKLHEPKPEKAALAPGQWFRSRSNNRITMQLKYYDASSKTWKAEDKNGDIYVRADQIDEYYEPIPEPPKTKTRYYGPNNSGPG